MKRGYGSSSSAVDPQTLTPPPAGPGPGAAAPAHRPRRVHTTAMSDPTAPEPEPDQGDVVPEQPDLEQQDRIRLHHWCASDDQRAPHDHPWPNTTTVLAGTLVEHTPDTVAVLTPGTVVSRQPTQPHRIELVTADAWTLFVTGPIVRRWGFHTDRGWVHWRDWPHAGHYLNDDDATTTSAGHPSREW